MANKSKKSVLIQQAEFSIEELKMERDLNWRMKLKVQKQLPKSYYFYSMTLRLNHEKYQERIKEKAAWVAHMEAQQELFPDTNKKLQDEQKTLQDLKDVYERMKSMTRDIHASVHVEEVKYRGNETLLSIRIPADIIPNINEQRQMFGDFIAELDPLAEPAND